MHIIWQPDYYLAIYFKDHKIKELCMSSEIKAQINCLDGLACKSPRNMNEAHISSNIRHGSSYGHPGLNFSTHKTKNNYIT